VNAIIESIETQTSSSASSTSNDIIRALGSNVQGLNTSINEVARRSSNFIDTFVAKFTSNIVDNSSNVNARIVTDSNILNEAVVQASNQLVRRITDLDSSASNYVRTSSNQIQRAIHQTSNDIQKYLTDVDRDTSNYVRSMSSNVSDELRISSNAIVDYITKSDTNISNYIYDTTSNMANSLRDTSNALATQVTDAFKYTSNYIDSTSNELDYTIRTTLQTIRDDINASDVISSNYVGTAVSNLSKQVTDFSDAINKRISSIDIAQLADGPTNKIIRSGVYPYDLTTCNLTVQGHVLPKTTLAYNLGSSDHRWRHMYLSKSTIYLGDIKISQQTSGNTNGLAIQNTVTNKYVDIVVSKLVVPDSTSQTGQLVEIKSQGGAIQTAPIVVEGQSGGGSGSTEATVQVEYTSAIDEITGASNLFYTDARARAIASASNLQVTAYINATSNNIGKRLTALTADNIANGTSNKFIIGGIYDGDLTIDGTLIVSNLTIQGQQALINTTTYKTERLEINANQFDGPALKVIQQGNQNVAEFLATESGNDRKKFTLTKDGIVKLENSGGILPGGISTDYKLQVQNNISFVGTLNGVTNTEFGYISDAASNIQSQIDKLRSDVASQGNQATQQFQTAKNNATGSLDNNITTSNAQFRTYVDRSSNAFGSNVDKLTIDLNNFMSNLDSNLSSNLKYSYSNIFDISIPKVNTDITGRLSTLETNVRSLITRTSNALNDTVVTTSNVISSRIVDTIINNNWISTSSNIYYQAGNVGLGVTNPSEKLDVFGNIRFTGRINEVTSNELAYLKGVTSDVKAQFDNAITFTKGYADRTCNALWNNIVSSSNANIGTMGGYTGTIIANVITSSNNFSSNLLATSNVLSGRITSYLASAGSGSPWLMTKTLDGDAYYNNGSVIISSTASPTLETISGANPKLQVDGSILIVDGDLKRTSNNAVEYYQLERWKDSANYDTSTNANRFIYNIDHNSSTGYVGIGLDVPEAKLHVGVGTSSSTFTHTYFDSSASVLTSPAAGTSLDNICAIFNSSIWTKGSVAASSDIRIKKNIVDVNDDTALQKILAIQPKTYDYIDPTRGTSNVFGFIAQQIREIIPEAVGVRKDVVPNIFTVATYDNYWVTFDEGFDVNLLQGLIGKKVCIIDLNGVWEKYTVVSITNNKIQIDKAIVGDKVFVYGAEIDDFHILDKSYIFTLNVCATQLLSRELDEITKQIEYLEGLYGVSPNQ
jgi:Chaperone of endosialidase